MSNLTYEVKYLTANDEVKTITYDILPPIKVLEKELEEKNCTLYGIQTQKVKPKAFVSISEYPNLIPHVLFTDDVTVHFTNIGVYCSTFGSEPYVILMNKNYANVACMALDKFERAVSDGQDNTWREW